MCHSALTFPYHRDNSATYLWKHFSNCSVDNQTMNKYTYNDIGWVCPVIAAIIMIISHHFISSSVALLYFLVLALPCIIITIWFYRGFKITNASFSKKKKQKYQNTLSFLISGELRGFSSECNMAVWKFLGQVSEMKPVIVASLVQEQLLAYECWCCSRAPKTTVADCQRNILLQKWHLHHQEAATIKTCF